MHTMTEDPQATADPVDVDDLAATDDAPTVPELDPEAALLCALLHTTDTTEARHITGHLEASDFLNPRYSDLYSVIADLIAAGEPHHAPRVLAALTNAGRMAGHQGRLLADALQVVALLGTPAIGVRTLAADGLACIVAKVEASGPASYAMDLHLLENRFAFARALREPLRRQR